MIYKFFAETFELTRDFTNAVVLAMMPIVADGQKALGLCDPCSTNLAIVKKYAVEEKLEPRGSVLLEKGHLFVVERGRLELYDSSHSYFDILDPDSAPTYIGELRMSQEEALKVARLYVMKLGYKLDDVFMDSPPKVDGPPKFRGKTIPHFLFTWTEPRGTAAEIEINANSGKVERAWLQSANFWREPLLPKDRIPFSKAHLKWLGDHAVSDEYQAKILETILPRINTFADKLELKIKLPVTREDVSKTEAYKWDHYLPSTRKWPSIYMEITLKDGSIFAFANGRITAFYGRNRITFNHAKTTFTKHSDKASLSLSEGRDRVRKLIKDLDPSIPLKLDASPNSKITVRYGEGALVRHLFGWQRGSVLADLDVSAEIDGHTGNIESIDIRSRDWHDPLPEIGLKP